jgi:WASH complex subunit strumpellin
MFLKQKVLSWDSVYQSKTIPIPVLATSSGDFSSGLTFMGRLAHQLLALTNPKVTIFVPARQAWYDFKTQGNMSALLSIEGSP